MDMKRKLVFIVPFLYLITSLNALAIPAFPGAEGYGAITEGGRGGVVYIVNSLDDDDPVANDGKVTLREAIEARESLGGNCSGTACKRTVVFAVAGTIKVTKRLRITKPYITIAGQTAPSGISANGDPIEGITIALDDGTNDPAIEIKTHDVVLRYLKVRPGIDPNNPGTKGDAISINGYLCKDFDTDPTCLSGEVYNIIIDHCSTSWASDGNIDISHGAHNVTVQWSILAEALVLAETSGQTGRGALFGDKAGSIHSITFHHNLLAHNRQRNPNINSKGECVENTTDCLDDEHSMQIYNNVIYNWGNFGMHLVANTEDGVQTNIAGNYFRRGINTTANRAPIKLFEIDSENLTGFHQDNTIYVYDNHDTSNNPNYDPTYTDIDCSNSDWHIMRDQNTKTPGKC